MSSIPAANIFCTAKDVV